MVSLCYAAGELLEGCREGIWHATILICYCYPALTWYQEQLWEVMNACVCMHNVIVESECEHPCNDNHSYDYQGPLTTIDHDMPTDFAVLLAMHVETRDADTHTRLQMILSSIYGGSKGIQRLNPDVFFYLKCTHKFISNFVVELNSKFQTTINFLVFMCDSWFNLIQKSQKKGLGPPFG
jgi:hypothetical protein